MRPVRRDEYHKLELPRSLATCDSSRAYRSCESKKKPSMVFLMETWRSASHAMNLKWRLGLKNSIGVDSLGQGGGIVLFGMRV
jgi:hypothetical protein